MPPSENYKVIKSLKSFIMRKLLVITALVFIAGIAFGQNLQKGNVLGLRIDTIVLKPGVTMDQYVDFLVNRFAPEYEKAFPGAKVYIMMGESGARKGWIGMITLKESIEVRDKLFRSPETAEARAKLDPIMEELEKYTSSRPKVTDWVIQ